MIGAIENGNRTPLRLILGGANSSTCDSTNFQPRARVPRRTDAARSAEALLALAPHAASRRYWLIDPFPILREIASGAALTGARLDLLNVVADALSAQLRRDDPAGQTILSAIRTGFTNPCETATKVSAVVRALGGHQHALGLHECACSVPGSWRH